MTHQFFKQPYTFAFYIYLFESANFGNRNQVRSKHKYETNVYHVHIDLQLFY